MESILAPSSVGISELKANPSAVFDKADNEPVAVLNRNKPVGYLIPAKLWETICDRLEDAELMAIAKTRLSDGKAAVEVALNDL